MAGRRNGPPVSPGAGGFTLVEILIACVVAALAFVTLTGLQSASVSSTLRAGNRQEAMLLMRRILAFVELNEDALEPVRKSGRPSEVLQAVSNDKGGRIDPDLDARYLAEYGVEDAQIGALKDGSMKRVSLSVSWGPDPGDTLSITYFVAQAPPEDAE